MYYNGIRPGISSDIKVKIPFEYCNLQIDSFDKILYEASPRVGPKLTLNFNFKKIERIYKHLVILMMVNMKKMVFQNIHYNGI